MKKNNSNRKKTPARVIGIGSRSAQSSAQSKEQAGRIKSVKDLTDKDVEKFGILLNSLTPPAVGFTLLLYDFQVEGETLIRFVSNADRKEQVEALRAMAAQLSGEGEKVDFLNTVREFDLPSISATELRKAAEQLRLILSDPIDIQAAESSLTDVANTLFAAANMKRTVELSQEETPAPRPSWLAWRNDLDQEAIHREIVLFAEQSARLSEMYDAGLTPAQALDKVLADN